MGNTVEWVSGGVPAIDANTLNEPFHIRTAAYNGGSGNVDVTIGPGRADFSSGGTVLLAVIPSGSTVVVSIGSPVVSTTYYVFLKPTNRNPLVAGDFRTSTSPGAQAGEVRLGSVTTGNPISSAVSRSDLRGILPVPSSSGPIKYDERIISNSAADITIPSSGSLPTGYRHIEIVYRLQNVQNNSSNTELTTVINGDTATHYQAQRLQGSAAVALAEESGVGYAFAGRVYVGGNGNSTPSTGRIFIPDYNFVGGHLWRVSWNILNGLSDPPGASGSLIVGETLQGWYNNAAITSVTLRTVSNAVNLTGVVTTYLWP